MPVKADLTHADKPVKVGATHDPAEAEADHLAEFLIATPGAQPLACGACAAGDAPCPACATGAATLRRKALGGEPAGRAMSPAVGQALSAPATPLPDAARRRFEHRLGTDLAALRVHTGTAAARAAHSMGARAFALGHDIVFGAGEYRPDTRDGQRLLAHEVAHVVQDGPGGTLRRKPSTPPDPVQDASDDERQLEKMQLLPESNFINGAASVGGLKAWQARYPLSYEEMKKRAVALYGEAGYERLLAADGQVLPLVQKSEMLMTRLTALRDRYDAEDEAAHTVIDAYGGTNFLIGDNVRGWFDLNYDWLGQQYSKYDNFDLGLFQALLSEDVDTLIERVAENADAAKLEADEEKERKEGWIEDGADVLGSVVARRDDVFFDDEIVIGDKDAAQVLRGKWVIELGELSALSRHDLAATKAYITRAVDSYRPSFGRVSRDFPRRCVFTASTNEAEYLKDPTGNRRFWPVPVKSACPRTISACWPTACSTTWRSASTAPSTAT